MPLPKDVQNAVDAALDARSIITFSANKLDVGGMTPVQFERELEQSIATIGISLRYLRRFMQEQAQTSLPV